MTYAYTMEQVHTFLAECGVTSNRVEGQVKGGFLIFLNNHNQVINAVGAIRKAGGNVIYYSPRPFLFPDVKPSQESSI